MFLFCFAGFLPKCFMFSQFMMRIRRTHRTKSQIFFSQNFRKILNNLGEISYFAHYLDCSFPEANFHKLKSRPVRGNGIPRNGGGGRAAWYLGPIYLLNLKKSPGSLEWRERANRPCLQPGPHLFISGFPHPGGD